MNIINRFYTYLLFFEVSVFVNSGLMDHKSFLDIPVGEFRLKFKSTIKCDAFPGNKLHKNIFYSKSLPNGTALKGNLTFNIPFDDTLTMHANLAEKDSNNIWKENAHVIVKQKACSTYKNFLGNMQWQKLLNSFGIRNHNCPIKPGVYVSTADGYDISSIQMMSNLPKTFFYGTYKCRLYFKDRQNVEHGCVIHMFEVKRLRETD